eukprot:10158717-Alexandrium_andersonii.AAC.1
MGCGRSTPSGPNGPLRGSELAKVGDPPPTLAHTEPRKGPFGPLGVSGPRPRRAGFWARSSL